MYFVRELYGAKERKSQKSKKIIDKLILKGNRLTCIGYAITCRVFVGTNFEIWKSSIGCFVDSYASFIPLINYIASRICI